MNFKKTLCAALSSVFVLSSVSALNVSADWETTSAGTKYWSTEQKTYAKGWWIIGSDDYYFNSDGIMQTGWFTDDLGRTYYLKSDGKMKTGWLRTSSGNKYYFDNTGIMHTGWLKSKNNYYYFNKDGKAIMGKTVKINGVSYAFDENGVWDGNGTEPVIKVSSAGTSSDSSDGSTKSVSAQYKEVCTLRDEAYKNVQSYQEMYDENTEEKQKWVDKMDEVNERIEKLNRKYANGKTWSDSDKKLLKKYTDQYNEYKKTALSYDKPITEAAKKKNEWSKLYNEYKKQAAELKKQL